MPLPSDWHTVTHPQSTSRKAHLLLDSGSWMTGAAMRTSSSSTMGCGCGWRAGMGCSWEACARGLGLGTGMLPPAVAAGARRALGRAEGAGCRAWGLRGGSCMASMTARTASRGEAYAGNPQFQAYWMSIARSLVWGAETWQWDGQWNRCITLARCKEMAYEERVRQQCKSM